MAWHGWARHGHGSKDKQSHTLPPPFHPPSSSSTKCSATQNHSNHLCHCSSSHHLSPQPTTHTAESMHLSMLKTASSRTSLTTCNPTKTKSAPSALPPLPTSLLSKLPLMMKKIFMKLATVLLLLCIIDSTC